MRRIMRLPSHVQIEYKKHQDSLVDKSSFRNPSLVWKAKDATAGPRQGGGYHKDGQGHREGGHREGGHYNKEQGAHREGGYNKEHHPRDKGTDIS